MIHKVNNNNNVTSEFSEVSTDGILCYIINNESHGKNNQSHNTNNFGSTHISNNNTDTLYSIMNY